MNYQIAKPKCSMRRCFVNLSLLASLLMFAVPAMASFTQQQKITSTPRGVGAQFGYAIAVSGNTMVVGARFDSTTASQAGAAFVYVLNGNTWTQQAILLASDGAAFDKFGQSVAIDGDTIVVGAYQANAGFNNNGAAYVFVRSGTTWTQQQKLTASDSTADDEFGNAVAIKGDSVIVGSHFADLPSNASAGSAYLYRRSGTVWSETQKLTPSGGVILGDLFGDSLAISGDKLVIGSPGADVPQTAAGSVYVYVEIGGGLYGFQQKLSIVDGSNGDNFGGAVAIDGNTLVGGAREDTTIVGQSAFGAAYVFQFDGLTWNSQQKLIASDPASFDRFGWSVAIRGDIVAVGAREDDTAVGAEAGSTYIFKRSGTVWSQQQKLAPNDPFTGDRFGGSVAFAAGNLIIGAAEKNLTSPNGQGAAYVFLGPHPVFPDFDGDQKADISLYRESALNWFYQRSSDSTIQSIQCGDASLNALIAPADFDGDGKTDPAVMRRTTGLWLRCLSSGGFPVDTFGTNGDLPMPADFDGDGKADLSVFRPSTGEWLRINSSNGQQVTVVFGLTGDIPLIGDFDGDGKSDPSYWRSSTASFSILRSSDGTTATVQLGTTSDMPVPADYDGDNITDLAVYNNGTWTIQKSSGGSMSQVFGISTDRPVPADYDGDGKADVAIVRSSDNLVWYLSRGTGGYFASIFGVSPDQPVPLFFVRQGTPPTTLQFSATNYTVAEDPGTASITVTRTGDLNRTVSVDYAVTDGTAKQTTDYSLAAGRLYFVPGEASKTFNVSITEDSVVEGTETANLTLSNPLGVAVAIGQSTATLTITDDATEPPGNPNDVAGVYVSQHYFDFLNREADPSGLAFWTNQITSCGNDAQCTEIKRVNVSGAYFLSIEFQETGYLVYRFYNAALNRSNGLPRYVEFLKDTQSVGRGVVVGATGWEAQLAANKVTFANEFVERAEFITLYPFSQTPTQFVDALYAHGGIVPSVQERQAAIDEFNNPEGARGRVLRRVAENQTLTQREFNRAFVLMQYFGYLRRNPDDAPDNDLSGFNFWLNKLNQFNGNFVNAEMVKAFITSGEYRHRFGAN